MANITPNTDLQVEITNRQILKIALPISLALLVPQINFVTNNIFLSRLGETELGTAGITGVFYLVFALVGNGLNSGLQGLIARRAGENRPADDRRETGTGEGIPGRNVSRRFQEMAPPSCGPSGGG